jgi:hypothetical protein
LHNTCRVVYNTTMSDDANKSILFVKQDDVKKGKLWNTITNRRIIKQHGGFDIPEGDLHAIPTYHSPVEGQNASPEDTKETLNELEKEINELKEKDKNTQLPPGSQHDSGIQFFDDPEKNFKKQENQDDDLY